MELISSHILERLNIATQMINIATQMISIAITAIIDIVIDKVLDFLSMRQLFNKRVVITNNNIVITKR